MSQALPPGTIAATRTSTTGACAGPIGPGMPGPGAGCYSCPPEYTQPQYRSWGVGQGPGSFYCMPLQAETGVGTETQLVSGMPLAPRLIAGSVGLAVGTLLTFGFLTMGKR